MNCYDKLLLFADEERGESTSPHTAELEIDLLLFVVVITEIELNYYIMRCEGFDPSDNNKCSNIGFVGSTRHRQVEETVVNNSDTAFLHGVCSLSSFHRQANPAAWMVCLGSLSPLLGDIRTGTQVASFLVLLYHIMCPQGV